MAGGNVLKIRLAGNDHFASTHALCWRIANFPAFRRIAVNLLEHLVPVEQCVITSFLTACERAFRSAVVRPFLSSACTHQLDQLGSDCIQRQDKINVPGLDGILRHAEILRRGPVLRDDCAAPLLDDLHPK